MKKSMSQRFWEKVECRGADECWPWLAATQRGYGAFRLIDGNGRRRQVNAQRVAYVLTYGPIPDGEHILHSCDTPLCCNPKHLSTGTRSDNMRQMVDRNRRAKRTEYRHISDALRESIKTDIRLGTPVREIARRHRVAPVTVRVIRRHMEGIAA